jgi:Outer membrane lipoprotein carrier protein LolA-like
LEILMLGSTRVLNRFIGALLGTLVLVTPLVQAQDKDKFALLDTILQQMAANPAARLRFVERKFLANLDAPIDSSGELTFFPPDKLQRRTLKPQAELLTIESDKLTVERGTRKQSIAIAQVPQVSALATTLLAVIKGDRRALTDTFEATTTGTAAQWSVRLKPLQPQAVGWLREIRLAGQKGQLELFELDLADGDRSVMRLLPVQ